MLSSEPLDELEGDGTTHPAELFGTINNVKAALRLAVRTGDSGGGSTLPDGD